MAIKQTIQRNISNIPGWRTKRKILVIESDDWGSVHTRDNAAYNAMLKAGLNVNAIHYDAYESLESNEDFDRLFDLLLSFKDTNGNAAVITPMCIMGNPDFTKIVDSNFSEYHFQPLHETVSEYPESNKIIEYWNKGYELGIFVPEIHGREHLNVRRYMQILKYHEGKEGLRIAARYKSFGPSAYLNFTYPNYLGALHPIDAVEIPELHSHLIEAGSLFRQYMGYKPRVFIAPNAEEPKELESSLSRIGVKYLTRSKKRVYPLGDGKFAKEWNFIGKQNEHGQTILNRNAFFEPVCFGEHEHITDWGASCLKEIEIAFRWKKPAVISSHRVNYVGSISPENRDKGLYELKKLLKAVLKQWPDVEFMSSFELGELIRKDKEKN